MKKYLFILFISTSISFSQGISWEYYGDMNKPVAGGDLFTEFDNFYIIGGYSNSLQRAVNWIQKFEIFENTWKIDSMSIARKGLVVEKYNDYAYFYGGINDESNAISGIEKWQNTFSDNSIFAYDVNFNRNYSTGHIIGNNFYIIGGNPLQGTSSTKIPYLVEYNLVLSKVTYQTDSLFSSGDLPDQQMSEAIGNDIYIFGGVENVISQDIYKFNTIDKTYKKLPIQLLEPRAGGRAILSTEKDKIFIIGGYNEDLEVLSSVEMFYVYGDDQYNILQGPSINEARYNFMTGDFEGRIFIFGGYNSGGNVIKSIEVFHETAVTSSDESPSKNLKNQFELHQNYPNPFNPATTISYTIPPDETNDEMMVNLKIYDVIGCEVAILVNQKQNAGKYQIDFNAKKLAGGIYFYQISIEGSRPNNSFILTKKMILLK